jgi:GT2 family glycosyltransferase
MNNRAGVVVIGRNEEPRLRACLSSACCPGVPVVYVDSGSTDGSLQIAASLGAATVELDASAPFTAARGRNAGFEALARREPAPELVQFVDGDCELDDGWLDAAVRAMDDAKHVAIVCGRVRERHAEASLYHRYYDVEWVQPPGETSMVGGIFMIRAAAFQKAGRFNPAVAAGEEPELCLRLRGLGWKILRLDRAMARHDAGSVTFRHWWNREVRTGRGMLDVAARSARNAERPFHHAIRSARLWGLGWPLSIAAALTFGWSFGNLASGLGLAIIVGLALPAQIMRITLRKAREGHALRSSLAYGTLTMLAKWPQLAGQFRHLRNADTPLRLTNGTIGS